MGTCKHCGKALDEAARFCSHCGAPAEETEREHALNFLTQIKGLPDPAGIRKGQLIDERYEVLSRDSESIYFTTFRVTDKQDMKQKRLKVIPSVLYDHTEAMDFLIQEFKSKLWLNSPHIIQVYSIQQDGLYKYIVTEYFKGRVLRELKYAAPHHRLPEKLVVGIALQIAAALEYSHNYNVICGSLQPDSILVNKEGIVKLDDFGMREALYNMLNMHLNISSLRSLVYMSPEQLTGKISSIRTDIYVFGLLLHELVTGYPPFFSGDIQHQILNRPVPDLEEVSPKFNLLIQRCLAKDPAKRYSQFSEIRTLLFEIKLGQAADEDKKPAEIEKKEPRQAAISMATADRFHVKRMLDGIKGIPVRYRYGLAALMTIFVIVLIMVSLPSGQPEPRKKLDAAEEVQAWSQLNAQQRSEMRTLLSRGDSLLRMGQLVEPADKNAYRYYQRVLAIFPHENRALEQLDFIRKDLLNQAKENINQGRFFKAESILLNGLSYYPADSALVSLTEKNLKLKRRYMTEEPISIEILNGAGVSGIAGQLSDYLSTRDFRVVNTENYRENGNLRWDVPESFIINRYGHNIRIERLAGLLGISNTQIDTTGTSAQDADITIILGLDYQTLAGFR
jgi:hypothetical protein